MVELSKREVNVPYKKQLLKKKNAVMRYQRASSENACDANIDVNAKNYQKGTCVK